MNDLSHLIKSLAYSLTVVPASRKCIDSLAQHHEYKNEFERLHKGIARHRSGGYDLESKQLPTESTCLTIVDRIQSNQIKIIALQKLCSLLTELEKTTLMHFLEDVLERMQQRADAAQAILEEMAKQGIDVNDLT